MTFKDWVGSGSSGLIGIVNVVIVPGIIALAFVAFLWGILSYFFLNPDDATKRAEGRAFIIWGILGMVVLFGVWGFVNFLLGTLGFAP